MKFCVASFSIALTGITGNLSSILIEIWHSASDYIKIFLNLE